MTPSCSQSKFESKIRSGNFLAATGILTVKSIAKRAQQIKDLEEKQEKLSLQGQKVEVQKKILLLRMKKEIQL